jgi:hypothetical protein
MSIMNTVMFLQILPVKYLSILLALEKIRNSSKHDYRTSRRIDDGSAFTNKKTLEGQ